MLNVFEFSRVRENIESWLVYANKLSWIAQSYFLNSIIKQSYCQLLFLDCKTFNRYDLSMLKKSNCFFYITIAKHCWVTKLEELKSDQKYFKSGNSESLKKYSQQFKSFSTNVPIVGEDLLRAFYRLFYLRFCDSSHQWKKTV